VTKILALVLGLAQLRSCANSFCGALDVQRFAPRTVRLHATAAQRVIDVAAMEGGVLLIVAGADDNPEDRERTVQRWSDRRGAELLFDAHFRDVIGEGVAATAGGQWWYTAAGNYENRWGAMFVVSNGSPRFVALPIFGGNHWLPLKGEVPGGLYLYQDHDATRAMEAAPDGIRRSWTIPGAGAAMRGWWAAERLPDGAIALASLEGAPQRLPSKVHLRVLRDDSYDEFLLESGSEANRVGIAADRSRGTVMVVVERPQGAIDAFLVDLRSGSSSRLRLSEADEKARFPAISATASGFVVAWTNLASRPAAIRARAIENGAPGLVAVTVGAIAVPPDREPVLRVVADDAEDVFAWEGSMQRRLPSHLAGFGLMTELRERLCSFTQRP
jgi:hypothetical protein